MSAIEQALQKAADLLTLEVKARLAAVQLEGSTLQQSVESKPANPDAVDIIMERYAEWVISGRRPFTKKIPLDALLQWIKKKGLAAPGISQTSLGFAIQNSIYKKGIRARDFLTPAVESVLPVAVDLLLEAIFKDLTEIMRDNSTA